MNATVVKTYGNDSLDESTADSLVCGPLHEAARSLSATKPEVIFRHDDSNE